MDSAMKFMVLLLTATHAVLSHPSLPVNPGGIGGLFEGPDGETIIKGPDGSVITSAAKSGEVQTTGTQPIIVEEEVPPPVLAQAVPPVEALPVAVTVTAKEQSSDLIGPSGRISTQGSKSVVAGPASTTVTGPAVVAETVVTGGGATALSTIELGPTPILTVEAPAVVPSADISSVTTVTGTPLAISAEGLGSLTSSSISVPLEASVATLPPLAPPPNLQEIVTVTGSPSINSVTGSPITLPRESLVPQLGISRGLPPGPQTDEEIYAPDLNVPQQQIELQISSLNSQLGVSPSPLPEASGPNGQLPSISLGAVPPLPPQGLGVSPSPLPPQNLGVTPNQIEQINLNGLALPPQVLGSLEAVPPQSLGVSPSPLPEISSITPLNINRIYSRPLPQNLGVPPSQINRNGLLLSPQDLSDSSPPLQRNPNVGPLVINGRLDLPQDQIAVDNRQPLFNPSVIIPSSNTIPPELDGRRVIQVTEGVQPPTTGLLRIPGLGSAVNIQRGEALGRIRDDENRRLAIQNQQTLLTNQVQTTDPRLLQQQNIVNIRPREELVIRGNGQLESVTADPRLAHQTLAIPQQLQEGPRTLAPTLASIQQEELLNEQLVRAGVDPAQVQLTNVPLSSVSGLVEAKRAWRNGRGTSGRN